MSEAPEELAAIVVSRGELHLVRAILAELILDYRKYDPEFAKSSRVASFRGGILTVTPNSAADFLRVLKSERLTNQAATDLADSTDIDLVAFIDFDSRQYIHSYYDLPLEDYVPRGWHAGLGDPREALRHHLSGSTGE